MYGAILGDIVGAPYEFDNGGKTRSFPLFSDRCEFTDDTVMTVAVAEALLSVPEDAEDDTVREALVKAMKHWGRKYPDAGYGGRFYHWLFSDNEKPYGSYGNGSAMRVAAAGWLYATLEKTQRMAELTADVTHNHPEGIKGALATATAVFMARTGKTKEEIKDYIEREYGYDLNTTLDEIRPWYRHVETCRESVPQAIRCFLEGESYEETLRNVMYIGGDTDTLGAIAGAVAEAFFGLPEELIMECRKRLPEEMLKVADKFTERIGNG